MKSIEEAFELDQGSMHITEEEAAPVIIAGPTTGDSDRMRSNCLVGKLMIDRGHDIRSMRIAFKQSWGCNFDLVRIRSNFFQIIFESQIDADRVINNGPWCFSNSLFCLKRWTEDWEASLDLFTKAEFWVHIVNLPYHMYTEAIGQHVAVALHTTGALQLRTEQPSGRRLFRMRVSVDLRKPIRRFVSVLINGAPLMGKLQYERLPHLCGQCGRWNHTVSACRAVGRELTEEERLRLPYGEKQEMNAIRKSTLLMEFLPGSTPKSPHTQEVDSKTYNTGHWCKSTLLTERLHYDSRKLDTDGVEEEEDGMLTSGKYEPKFDLLNSQLREKYVTSLKPVKDEEAVVEEKPELIGNEGGSALPKFKAELLKDGGGHESANVQFINWAQTKEREDIVRGRGTTQSSLPISHLVVNLTPDVAPVFTNFMQQFIRHTVGNLNGFELGRLNRGGTFSRGVQEGTKGRYISIQRGARYMDFLMHRGTSEQCNMEKKRKSEDIVDGESCLKKTRLSIIEPLVESAVSQAHPAQ